MGRCRARSEYAPAADRDREPPLVHLSGEFSPFTHLRETPFAVEDVPDALDTADFLSVVTRLPVPVIGLLGTVRALTRPVFATLPEARRDAWDTWLPEVFADLYGVLAAGPAFASALADLLVVDPARAAAEIGPDAPVLVHPPAAVRLALAARALAETGFAAEAQAVRRSWPTGCGPFEDDVAPMTAALLDGAYPGLGDRPRRRRWPAARRRGWRSTGNRPCSHRRRPASSTRRTWSWTRWRGPSATAPAPTTDRRGPRWTTGPPVGNSTT
ncbi:hypothetical protein [Saccharothrix sp. HUAS TT1]|uniref:hypothetical protein n=1 Tax=unclassified Saccharothrix TaxID=2593673 RepID=UPI00345BE332